MSYTSRAIVLSKGDFGEADRYVEFYTQKWGVVSALAKSARKSKRRYVGGLDLFCHDEIHLRGDPKGHPYLVELTVLNSFQGIRSDLRRLFLAGGLTKWVQKLTRESSPMPAVYSLLGQTLSLIETTETEELLERLGVIFKIKLLSYIGLQPRVQNCAQCGSDALSPAHFDFASGGVLCHACRKSSPDQLQLSLEERHFIHWAEGTALKNWQTKELSQDLTKRLANLMTHFASYHSHIKLSPVGSLPI